MKFKLVINTWNISLTDITEKLTAGGELCSGTIHYSTQEIFIDKNLRPIDLAKTIRHELTHAVIYETQITTGITYTEEDMCEFLAKYGEIITSLANNIISNIRG